MGGLRSRTTRVVLVVALQLVLLAAAVAGQLSARLTGAQYLVRVAPLDPIDPFRGAYVALSYPDLTLTSSAQRDGDGNRTVYVPLTRQGDIWVGGTPVSRRPAGPALRCVDKGWRLGCGIDSYFLPQAEAKAMEDAVRAGTARARLRVDSAGRAAIVGLVLDS